MGVVCIIPARYHSSRFKGKMLAHLWGKPIIQHVYERALQAQQVSKVWVATDHKKIFTAVTAFGGNVVMTSPKHQTGSDRIAEVAQSLRSSVVINLQGDEPLIPHQIINKLASFMVENRTSAISTVCTVLQNKRDINNPNVVKVVTDRDGNALYFSRSPVPFYRDVQQLPQQSVYKHIGIYAFRKRVLLSFASLPQSPLEKAEKLEQLRLLEHGFKIKVLKVSYKESSIDTPLDLKRLKNSKRNQR